MKSTIDKLLVNSLYDEPVYYWSYEHETCFFTLKGYVVASESFKTFDDRYIREIENNL